MLHSKNAKVAIASWTPQVKMPTNLSKTWMCDEEELLMIRYDCCTSTGGEARNGRGNRSIGNPYICFVQLPVVPHLFHF